jgi:hypothetical protein
MCDLRDLATYSLVIIITCSTSLLASDSLGVAIFSKLPGHINIEPMGTGKAYFNPHDTVVISVGNRSTYSAPNHCGIIDSINIYNNNIVVLKVKNIIKSSFKLSFDLSNNDTICFKYRKGYGNWYREYDISKCKCNN